MQKLIAWESVQEMNIDTIFMKKILCLINVTIFIEKNIPIAAGLAGGSTDAAATLKALNSIFDNVLSDIQLNQISMQA